MCELLDLGLHGGGDEFGRAVLGELQGAHVGDDGPALLGGELVAVTHHGVLAVGDDVEDLAVRVGADEGRLEAGDRDDGGVAFDGGTAENQPIELGAGRLIPGFEEQLVGVAESDKRAALEAIKKLLEGSMPGLPDLGFGIVDVTTREADLEDVFVSLTSSAAQAA